MKQRIGLVGGRRKTAAYMDRIEHRAKALTMADRPKKKRVKKPGEENQFTLDFVDKHGEQDVALSAQANNDANQR